MADWSVRCDSRTKMINQHVAQHPTDPPMEDDDQDEESVPDEDDVDDELQADGEAADREPSEADGEVALESKQRVLPDRCTRGKRFAIMADSQLDADRQFWSHETWLEDADEDWLTDDEGHYSDEFESDFDEETESDEASGEEPDEDGDAERKDRLLRGKKRGVYVDPRTANLSKHKPLQSSGKRGFSGEPSISHSKRQRVDWNLRLMKTGAKHREPTQAEHLAVVSYTEQINLATLNQIEEQENSKSMMREQGAPSVWQGTCDTWACWSSDRPIETGEGKAGILFKTDGQPMINEDGKDDSEAKIGSTQIGRNVESRQMRFFVNLSAPHQSDVPEIYRQRKPKYRSPKYCVITGQIAKYFDPLTEEFYNNRLAFRTLRQRYHHERHRVTVQRLVGISRRLAQLTGDRSLLSDSRISESRRNES